MIRRLFDTYENLAASQLRDRKFRQWLCDRLGCPFDSCYTIGELVRDAKLEGKYGWDPDGRGAP